MNLFNYPRLLRRKGEYFDPVELAKITEKIVCNGDKRKYTNFYTVGVYRGISTGYGVGCCLRCFFCWSYWSRDFPELYGKFYSPEEAFNLLDKSARRAGVNKLRISGCEPTIGRSHLIKLLELVEESDYPLFILETNGILFGADKSYVKEISRFTKVHVRVSLKAGLPDTFAERTGARPESFELPFKAIEYLLDYGVSFHVAAMTDPRIMHKSERLALIERLKEIDIKVAANLEEELIDPYDTTIVRMYVYGIDPVRFFSRRSW